VKLLANPLVLRMLLVAVSSGSLFLFGLLLVRKMRKDLAQDGSFTSGQAPGGAFEFQAFQAVIQDLKKQQRVLQDQLRQERQQAQTQGRLQAAALETLPCGVLLLNSRLLVQQANPAAKELLGFDAPTGLRSSQIFESGRVSSDEGGTVVAEAVAEAARVNAPKRGLRIVYATPAGQKRNLGIDVVPVGNAREVRGLVCVISKDAEISQAVTRATAEAQAASAASET